MTILDDTQAAADYLKANCHPECARKMQAAADEIRRLQALVPGKMESRVRAEISKRTPIINEALALARDLNAKMGIRGRET